MAVSRFRVEELKSLAFGSIVAGYTAIGASYAAPISKLHIVNNTDGTLLFSFDGVTNHLRLPSGAFLLLDITMESQVPDYLPKGDSMYVKRDETPTSGTADVTAFYGTNL